MRIEPGQSGFLPPAWHLAAALQTNATGWVLSQTNIPALLEGLIDYSLLNQIDDFISGPKNSLTNKNHDDHRDCAIFLNRENLQNF